MAITVENVEDLVRYHKPTDEQVARMNLLRAHALGFLRSILEGVPDCADRSAALRKVREALWTANAAVMLGGKV